MPPMQPLPTIGAEDFAVGLRGLLPTGDAFRAEPGSVQARLVAAIADGFAALHARAGVLTEIESDPALTVELLGAWEADYGLPDPCLPLDATLAQRRAALAARIAEGVDPTPDYFVALALTLGYVVTVTPDDGTYGAGWQHVWHINAPTITTRHAHAGANVAGDYLEVRGNGVLECVLRRAAPGHSILLFNYS